MKSSVFKTSSPWQKLLFSVFVILVSLVVVSVLAFVIALPFFGLEGVMNVGAMNLDDPKQIALLKFLQTIQSIGLFVIPPFILAWLFSDKISRYLALVKPKKTNSILLVLLIMLFAIPVINLLGIYNSDMDLPALFDGIEDQMKIWEESAAELTEAFLAVNTTPGLLFNLFMIAIIPAVGEELLFRGIIQKLFIQWTKNIHWGIIIAAVLFSAIHMQFYGFLPRFLLGALFGYLLIWSGSVWLPVFAHFINNAIGVVAYYLYAQGKIDMDPDTIGATPEDIHIAIICALATALLLILFYRHEKRIAAATSPDQI